ncbi:hypothetical protein N2599_11535 [Rhizobium sullae]|uniref:Uncharacterized protein n=1 Tax=Rhizobium sullae TaxID=50338 RepID=A0ABY5XFJ2_RHISU|nr:hypothetical protein [Rhizobium sullae]UWU12807.1 hypothetical protein N2599_11535 [Rhizobium sullae]
MAFIQIERIFDDIHVWANFAPNDDIIGFGQQTFDEVLARIDADNHVEIKAVFDDVRASGGEDCLLTFEINPDGCDGISDFKAEALGHELTLGCYFVFAEGGGLAGVFSWARAIDRIVSQPIR